VNVEVVVIGVVDGASDNVMIKGRAVVVGVADGINGGVGDRIAGKDEGETTGVLITNGMFVPPQAARKKRAVKARIVFIIITFDLIIVSEFRKKAIVFSHKTARKYLPVVGCPSQPAAGISVTSMSCLRSMGFVQYFVQSLPSGIYFSCYTYCIKIISTHMRAYGASFQ